MLGRTLILVGALIGVVKRRDARPQRCLLPPDCGGEVISIAAAGEYTNHDTIRTLRDASGETREIAMSHRWPVRQPRPVIARMPVEGPMPVAATTAGLIARHALLDLMQKNGRSSGCFFS